ncbi:MAG: SRPBCC family protein [Sphingobacterium sp.]
MKTEIKHQWIYEQSSEEIWKYLTESELIALWLMPNNFKAVVGYEFEFWTNPIPALELNGVFYCKVLEVVPLKKLVYSWKGGPSEEITTLDTLVEWTLEEQENGTLLNLRHSGFKDQNYTILTGMTDGWLKNIQKMLDLLNKNNDCETNS